MNGSRRKFIRRALADQLGRAPTKSEMRRAKRAYVRRHDA